MTFDTQQKKRIEKPKIYAINWEALHMTMNVEKLTDD